jgi:hypothetical protein
MFSGLLPPWLRGQVAMGSFIYSFYRVVLLGIAAACVSGLWQRRVHGWDMASKEADAFPSKIVRRV